MAKFLPGQSGNPGGRPKGEGNIRALAQQHGPAAIKRLAEIMAQDDDRKAAASAAEKLLDRGYGKATQPITGERGGPLKHEMTVTSLLEQLDGKTRGIPRHS